MASRSRSRIPARLTSALVIAIMAAGCDPSSAPSTTAITTPISMAGTAELVTTTSTVVPVTSSDPEMEVRAPEGEGPFPAVVLVHGGGWVSGTPSLMTDLARFLTGEGYLTVNTSYTLSNGVAGFPLAVDDVACAIRHAAAHPDSDGTVAVAGFSAGAHIGALAALDDGTYGASCSIPDPVIPDRFVGLAGPYDVARIGLLVVPFFGVRHADDPELWMSGNPLQQASRNPELESLLLHGENDSLVDLDFATDFASALTEAGSEALVEVVEGARHGDLQDPEVVGDLIAAWLARDR